MSPEKFAAFIRERLPVTPVREIPEIRLHLAGPASGLALLASETPPYWARCWGGGLPLARHVLDHREVVAGRRVVDLGCGGGVVAIAAALAGAASVVAVDVDPHAVVAAGLNATLNGVTIETRLADLTNGAPPDAEVLLAGDVFYDAALAERMAPFLDRCVAAGLTVLVGDPGRRSLPLARLRKLAEYPVTDFGAAAPAPAGVYAWTSATDGTEAAAR